MHYTFISLKDGVAFVFALKFLGERKATYIKKKILYVPLRRER